MTQRSLVPGFRMPSTFTALRYPNYRRWFIGQALSLMGTWMQSVAQGWLVYALTGSKLALGLISFAGSIPTLFLMLPAGVVADRVSRRKLMMVTQTSMMLFAFALAALAAANVLQVWHIAVLAFLGGVANSFDAPARLALAVEMVEDRRDLQNAIALNSTMFNLARIVGPAIGGVVLAGLGATWCFALNGLSFVAVLIALFGMRLNDTMRPAGKEPMGQQIKIGLRYVWDHRAVRTLMFLVGMTSLFGFSYSVLMPAYAVDILNVGEAGLGGLNAAVGIGALAGSLVVASLTRSRRKGIQLTIGSLLFPAAVIVFAFSRSFSVSLAFLAVIGFAFISQNATSNTLIQAIVPDELRGRVMSVYSFMFFGAAPFGALLVGALAQALGPTMAVAICAAITLVAALLVFLGVPEVRRLEM
ncbi:MAG: MFS transporter [Chloroflexi bacterium]|nr:MFS transporter [Chloroflexota bacterium]